MKFHLLLKGISINNCPFQARNPCRNATEIRFAKPAWGLGTAILLGSRGLLLRLGGNSLTKMGSASPSEWLLFDFPFWKVGFFFFLRGTIETALHWSTLQHPLSCHLRLFMLWVDQLGPPGWVRVGGSCWQRAPSCTYPCEEDYPLSLRLSAGCCKTWRINCPSCPDPAFYKHFKGWKGRQCSLGLPACRQLLLGLCPTFRLCLLFRELVLSSGRVVTEQKWDSPFSCALLSLFSILLISVGICIASNMIITIT